MLSHQQRVAPASALPSRALGNDNGFVFRRTGRSIGGIRPVTKAQGTPTEPSNGDAESNTENNAENDSTRQHSAATNDTAPHTKSEATPSKRQGTSLQLVFPDRKRRQTQQLQPQHQSQQQPQKQQQSQLQPGTPKRASATDISVPLRRPPQPTPLISRTRKRTLGGAAASPARSGARRMTAHRKSTLAGRRRSTFSMRGKRASSIGGGFKALPHESVGSGDFYRHISPELPEPIRLRQLLAWSARRTTPTLEQWPEELPEAARRLLSDVLREAVEDMHAAFEKGAIATSWYHRPVDPAEAEPERPLASHPENAANAAARDELTERIRHLRDEETAWVAELRRASAAHARALDRLPRPVQGLLPWTVPAEPLSRAAESVDWEQALDSAPAEYALHTSAAVAADVEAAEQSIEQAVRDLQVRLDAFGLSVHRAGAAQSLARETADEAAGALGFALAQRRARADVVARQTAAMRTPSAAGSTGSNGSNGSNALLASAGSNQPSVGTRSEGCDPTRALLRTLSAALHSK
ncbi:hypothetical protein GGI07_004397 [Coemansia sp. Benny D115]|nr:hypothetical protein GGI07_004397 [Coemansia sp. Benny D115]